MRNLFQSRTSLAPEAIHYPHLDTLRAFAAVWVIFRHGTLYGYFPKSGALTSFYGWGNSGVVLFFVLSGYLISRLIVNEMNSTGGLDIKRFWARRWLRTLPVAYVVFLVLRLGEVPEQFGKNWGGFTPYIFFLQNYLVPQPRYFNWAWSLCVEEQFYFFLPLVLFCIRKLRKAASAETLIRGIGLYGILLSLVLILPAALRGEIPNPYLTHHNLCGLFVGVFLASLPTASLVKGRGATVALLAGLAILGAAFQIRTNHYGGWDLIYPLLLSLGFGGIMLGALGAPFGIRGSLRGTSMLADLSYSAYLVHVPVLLFLTRTQGSQKSFLMALFITGLLSLGLHILVEVPFLKLRRLYFPSPGVRRSSPPKRQPSERAA